MSKYRKEYSIYQTSYALQMSILPPTESEGGKTKLGGILIATSPSLGKDDRTYAWKDRKLTFGLSIMNIGEILSAAKKMTPIAEQLSREQLYLEDAGEERGLVEQRITDLTEELRLMEVKLIHDPAKRDGFEGYQGPKKVLIFGRSAKNDGFYISQTGQTPVGKEDKHYVNISDASWIPMEQLMRDSIWLLMGW